ncbi:MAG: phosphoribosylformylglycinamidine synthase subunit PurL [Bacteroidota bacterium]|nr:phosphoribosylformylglycinamidine synthase subunit PurL [Bacteroidota bacterium]
MIEPIIDLELAIKHGLTEEEYKRILEILGRVPNYTELGIFSVMWSEHCSYKNSIAELKKLPRTGERLLVKAGEENAGLVDIGDGLAVAFKIESHNHPSAVEPYQGAATGVGGIMRDIFTMGARPIAALNSLRFGNLDNPRTRYLMKGIVKGIGDYGNCFGVPTVAGDVYFDDCYNENPIVNAMSVGIVKHSEVARAVAKGEGNIVMIVGSSTGRDGIHGATFASEEISEKSESKRPSVQVGDPFTEKLLLEATLEAIKAGLVIGIQDMGAAGITCSTSEMSARGKSGMVIDLDHVPVREINMTAYEIMLSESQERMLVVTTPENQDALKRIFDKWELNCRAIGTVTNDDKVKVFYQDKQVADVPAESLVLGGGAPVYYREAKEPDYIHKIRNLDFNKLPEPINYNDCLLQLLSSPNICSRRWIYTQYDTMVRTNTMVEIVGDAAVVHLKGTNKALAMKTDCNPRYVYLNPYEGSKIAVAESARNVVCVGAKPLAITNCLNFGNPYKSEIFWQFKESVRGIADACRELGTPVTGGNVSFYNENPDGAVYPTPVIGMIGEINDISKVVSADFKNVDDVIIILGDTFGHIGGSEYLRLYHNKVFGDSPSINLMIERNLQTACLEMINQRLVNSAHDISDGGLAVTLAECSIYSFDKNRQLGIQIDIDTDLRRDFYLFGEDQSRIIISINPENMGLIESIANHYKIYFKVLGKVVKNKFQINNCINFEVADLAKRYNDTLRGKAEIL